MGSGKAGDLYLEVEFNPHRFYRVEGADVFLELPLAPWEAALGSSVKVPTPSGAIDLKIPADSQAGKKLRLKGRGIPAKTPGDLCLEVEFKPHGIYRVEGSDVFLELPLAPWEAALGASVKVPTPSGTIDLKIPADSQAGKKLRLKGRGIPAKTPGDLYLVLQIVLPSANDEKAQSIYRRMQEEMEFNPRASMEVA